MSRRFIHIIFSCRRDYAMVQEELRTLRRLRMHKSTRSFVFFDPSHDTTPERKQRLRDEFPWVTVLTTPNDRGIPWWCGEYDGIVDKLKGYAQIWDLVQPVEPDTYFIDADSDILFVGSTPFEAMAGDLVGTCHRDPGPDPYHGPDDKKWGHCSGACFCMSTRLFEFLAECADPTTLSARSSRFAEVKYVKTNGGLSLCDDVVISFLAVAHNFSIQDYPGFFLPDSAAPEYMGGIIRRVSATHGVSHVCMAKKWDVVPQFMSGVALEEEGA